MRFGPRIFVVGAFACATAGCNRNDAAPTAPSPAAVTQPAPKAAAILPGTELPLTAVDSVMLSRPADSPQSLVIRVSGTAPSDGWTGAKLVADKSTDPTVAVMKLVAASPAPGATPGPHSVQTEVRFDSLGPQVTTIRIVSATNQVAAPVTPP